MKIKILCPGCDSVYEIDEPTEDTTNITCPWCDTGLPIDGRDFDITEFIHEGHKDTEP